VPGVQELMWRRFGGHLESLGGPDHRDKVFAYIDREDSPRSLPFQIELLQQSGFSLYDVLHRNGVSACYFAEK
jgi:tRNA (cmo5U34)-methyltransferase